MFIDTVETTVRKINLYRLILKTHINGSLVRAVYFLPLSLISYIVVAVVIICLCGLIVVEKIRQTLPR